MTFNSINLFKRVFAFSTTNIVKICTFVCLTIVAMGYNGGTNKRGFPLQ